MTYLPGVPPLFSSLHFSNDQDGWVGGRNTILATTNGGRSWRRQYRGPGDVMGFSFLSPKLGFAATSAGLLKTEDGKTWHRVDAEPLHQVQFFSAEDGVALAGPSTSSVYTIVSTQDGGRTWHSIEGATQACFFSPKVGVADPGGSGGTIALVRTDDGGRRWSTVYTIEGAQASDLACTRDGGAWFVAAGTASMDQQAYTVFHSANEGRSWRPVLAVARAGSGPAPGNPAGAPEGPGSSPGPIAAVSRSTAVMTGVCQPCAMGSVSFSATRDGGFSWSRPTPPIPVLPTAPVVLDMRTAEEGWLLSSPALGTGQEIEETTDGGATWHRIFLSGPSTPTLSVAFVSPARGYGLGAPGDARAVLRTTDGGRTWRKMGDLPPQAVFTNALAATPQGRVFALGNARLYESVNGGRSWLALPDRTLPAVPWMSFAAGGAGCAGGAGAPYITRDGGRTWRRSHMSSVPVAICAVSLVAPRVAEEATGLLHRLTSGGSPGARFSLVTAAAGGRSLWIVLSDLGPAAGSRLYILAPTAEHVVQFPTSINIESLSPVSSNTGFITTSDGRLLVTSDSGRDWMQV